MKKHVIRQRILNIANPSEVALFMSYDFETKKNSASLYLDRSRRESSRLLQLIVHLSTSLSHRLETVDSKYAEYVQSIYLLRAFVLSFIDNPLSRGTALEMLFPISDRNALLIKYDKIRYLLLFIWALLHMLCAASAFYFGSTIGSRAISLWLSSFLLALYVDIFILEVIKVVMSFTFLHSFSANRRVQDLLFVLKERVPYLLRRPLGLISFHNSLIQHFNPACRVARAFPSLSASRLLMALNDSDLGILSQTPKKTWSSYTFAALSSPLSYIMHIPQTFRKIIVESLIIVLVFGIVLSRYEEDSQVYALPLLALVFTLIVTATYLYLYVFNHYMAKTIEDGDNISKDASNKVEMNKTEDPSSSLSAAVPDDLLSDRKSLKFKPKAALDLPALRNRNLKVVLPAIDEDVKSRQFALLSQMMGNYEEYNGHDYYMQSDQHFQDIQARNDYYNSLNQPSDYDGHIIRDNFRNERYLEEEKSLRDDFGDLSLYERSSLHVPNSEFYESERHKKASRGKSRSRERSRGRDRDKRDRHRGHDKSKEHKHVTDKRYHGETIHRIRDKDLPELVQSSTSYMANSHHSADEDFTGSHYTSNRKEHRKKHRHREGRRHRRDFESSTASKQFGDSYAELGGDPVTLDKGSNHLGNEMFNMSIESISTYNGSILMPQNSRPNNNIHVPFDIDEDADDENLRALSAFPHEFEDSFASNDHDST
jgi:hypothetical protein